MTHNNPRQKTTASIAPLPDELWVDVCKWWPNNYEMQYVVRARLISRVFAAQLRWRVYAHAPSAALFVREARFMYLYNVCLVRRQKGATDLYGKTYNMIYNRHFEHCYGTSRLALQREQRQHEYHRALLEYMNMQGRLLGAQFRGFVCRLNKSWTQYYMPRHNLPDLDSQLHALSIPADPVTPEQITLIMTPRPRGNANAHDDAADSDDE